MESMSKVTGILEAARDLTLEAARDARAARRPGSLSSQGPPGSQVKKLLDSRNDRDVLEGLRKVIGMTYRGQPCLQYFTAVVKNIASSSLEIKKLVYIYLLHHAEAEPDTALLSINTIQKSLSDGNAQVRALALRVMSAIRVPVISQIVALGIKRGVADMSPHVRKTAALAIPKCYRLDPNTLPQLLDHLAVLLGDRQYLVAGAAVSAFLQVAPQRLDLVHPHYRSLVRKIIDMDEWGQLATLQLMLVYARKSFPRKFSKTLVKDKHQSSQKNVLSEGFYEEEYDNHRQPGNEQEESNGKITLDPDLDLLLSSIKPLLQSRNSAVIIAVVRNYYYLGLQKHLDSAIGPLISLLRAPQDIHSIALYYMIQICLTCPKSFTQYAQHFFVRSTDTPDIYQLKLELLTLIYPHAKPSLKGLVLNELEHFSRVHDQNLVHESVRAIGRCAQADTDTSQRCLSLLLRQISSPDGNLVAEALEVVRQLILREPKKHQGTVVRLAKSLDAASNPQARACIIWLVGEFASIEPQNNIAADVLRILAKAFADEPEAAKLQIILLAAKVYAHHLNSVQNDPGNSNDNINDEKEGASHDDATLVEKQQTIQEEQSKHIITQLWSYIMLLARYDTSYDLRDRARLYKALLALPSSTELATLMLLSPKPIPKTPSPSESRRAYTLGSATLVLGIESNGLGNYEELPDWVEAGQEPDPRFREDDSGMAKSSPGGAFGTLSSISSDGKRVEMGGAGTGGARAVPAGDLLDNAIRDKASKYGKTTTVAEGRVVARERPANGAKEKSLDDWLDEEDDDVLGADDELKSKSNDYNIKNDENDESDDEYTDASESETESGSADDEDEEGSTEAESDSESGTGNENERKGLMS